MALIGTLSINALVSTKNFAAGLGKMSGMLGGFANKVNSTGNALAGLAAAGGVAALGAGLYKAVKSASDLTETTSKLEGTFGPASKVIIDETNRMNLAFGTSKVEFMDATAVLGGLFKNMGYTADQATTLSVTMARLADDVSSRFNISFQDAFTKLRSGISGESEPLKALGVLMDEQTVKAQAAAMGIRGLGGELTQSQKVQARLAIITKQLADAQGDHAKTADEVAGSLRSIGGRVETLVQTLGQQLEPVAKSVLGQLNTGVQALSLYWEDNKNEVVAWGQTAVGSVGQTSESMGWLQKSIGFVADAWQTMKLGFYAAQSFITSGLATIVQGLAKLAGALDYIVEKISGAKLGIQDFLNTWSEDLNTLSNDQWKKFQTELAKPPASSGVNEYFAKAAEKIQAVRKEIAKPGPDISKIAPAAGGATKKAAPKFASAAVAGSAEAANAILMARFGGGKQKGPADQTAKNTGEMVRILHKISGNFTRFTPPAPPDALAGVF